MDCKNELFLCNKCFQSFQYYYEIDDDSSIEKSHQNDDAAMDEYVVLKLLIEEIVSTIEERLDSMWISIAS